MLKLDYQAYSSCLGQFFQIEPVAGETIAMDVKVLRGSYNRSTNARTTESYPAIQLVTVYVVERGLILPIQPVDCKSNEIKALPPVIKELAQRGVVFALARNFALNLYREYGFSNMAQAQRKSGFGIQLLKVLFRMKEPCYTTLIYLISLSQDCSHFAAIFVKSLNSHASTEDLYPWSK
jgi:hypothetical protein